MTHSRLWIAALCVLVSAEVIFLGAQIPSAPAPSPAPNGAPTPPGTPAAPAPIGKSNNNDLELVEKLIMARREYRKSLEQLRAHYIQAGDVERSRWAEEELRLYQRIPKQAFRLELDVPPPNIQGNTNIPEANRLFTWGMTYKNKGWGNEFIDNQRRAEILFQELLTKYPQSDKISDTAYMLGDIYESKAYKHYRRAASYYERCFQWNPKTNHDARLRAARIYDKQLNERGRAMELYREVTTHEADPARITEANRRLTDLAGKR